MRTRTGTRRSLSQWRQGSSCPHITDRQNGDARFSGQVSKASAPAQQPARLADLALGRHDQHAAGAQPVERPGESVAVALPAQGVDRLAKVTQKPIGQREAAHVVRHEKSGGGQKDRGQGSVQYVQVIHGQEPRPARRDPFPSLDVRACEQARKKPDGPLETPAGDGPRNTP